MIQSAGPASLLVFIESRMSETLRHVVTPEDVLQEALLCAWRDRGRFEWRGPKSFRAWLVSIIENRIRDAVLRETALKRGGGTPLVRLEALDTSEPGEGRVAISQLPFGSTTPSRLASCRERAAALRAALESLPDDVRDVVRLRIFEQKSLEDIAEQLGIGSSAALRRFRKGLGLYHHRLRGVLTSRSLDGRVAGRARDDRFERRDDPSAGPP